MFEGVCTPDMSGYVKKEDIVNDLLSDEVRKPLSAAQGKELRLLQEADEVTGGELVGTTLSLIKASGNIRVDIGTLLDNVNAISGSYDSATQSIVIQLNNGSHFSIPVAALLPVLTDDSISGNGSGIPLSVALAGGDNSISKMDDRIYSRTNTTNVFTYTSTKSFGTTTALAFTTDEYKIRAGNVEMLLDLPLRNNSYTWGGCYIMPVLYVNGVKHSLGTTGYDGAVMAYSAQMISRSTKPYFFTLEEDSTLYLEVYLRTYDNIVILNGSHDINSVSKAPPISDTEFEKDLRMQNFATIIIKEVN